MSSLDSLIFLISIEYLYWKIEEFHYLLGYNEPDIRHQHFRYKPVSIYPGLSIAPIHFLTSK